MNSEKLKFTWLTQDIYGCIRFHYTEPNDTGLGWFCDGYYNPEVLNPGCDYDNR